MSCCRGCGADLPESRRWGMCESCRKIKRDGRKPIDYARTLAWKRAHRDRVRELSRKSDRKRYWENPERVRARKLADYYANRESWQARYNAKPIEAKRAWWAVKWAVESGKIHRPPVCSRCEEPGHRIEAHHEDYSKPLEVTWLCSRCHGELRRIG